MENFLFCNLKNQKLFRYFRLGQEWFDCYVVEFLQDANHYNNLYWGNYDYLEKDRRIISELLTISFLSDPNDEWKNIGLENKLSQENFVRIIEEATKEIEEKKKEYEKRVCH